MISTQKSIKHTSRWSSWWFQPNPFWEKHFIYVKIGNHFTKFCGVKINKKIFETTTQWCHASFFFQIPPPLQCLTPGGQQTKRQECCFCRWYRHSHFYARNNIVFFALKTYYVYKLLLNIQLYSKLYKIFPQQNHTEMVKSDEMERSVIWKTHLMVSGKPSCGVLKIPQISWDLQKQEVMIESYRYMTWWLEDCSKRPSSTTS